MEELVSAIINQHVQADINTSEPLDIVRLNRDQYHLVHEGQSYRICVEHVCPSSKELVMSINDIRYEVTLQDVLDRQLIEMGYAAAAEDDAQDIIAPMPGKVLDVLVAAGDTVEAGQPLLILEAMKMENVIKAHDTGEVADVSVSVDQNVQKGDVMVAFL